MEIILKIPGPLYERIQRDMKRRHPFAMERVGFTYARSATVGRNTHLYLFNYEPVAERDYIDDRTVGARINSSAIRRAMQGILDRTASCFHVHSHWGSGRPAPSMDDLEGNVPIVQSFARLCPERFHGMVIFSDDGAYASVWTGEEQGPMKDAKVNIIGFPYRTL